MCVCVCVERPEAEVDSPFLPFALKVGRWKKKEKTEADNKTLERHPKQMPHTRTLGGDGPTLSQLFEL